MSDLSRRGMFLKFGILFNGVVGVLLGVPIVRYLLSPVARGRKESYESWIFAWSPSISSLRARRA